MNTLVLKQNSTLNITLKEILTQYGYENIDTIFLETDSNPINIKEETTDRIYFCNKQYIYETSTRRVFKNNIEIKLTKREINLLQYILENKYKNIFTFDELATVISEKEITKETVKSAVSTLNSKFNEPVLINEYGIGYRVSKNLKLFI